jgi:hypothetical protein
MLCFMAQIRYSTRFQFDLDTDSARAASAMRGPTAKVFDLIGAEAALWAA